ncbi:hypothetical protein ACK8GG_12300 [Micromonosporaceae bacterium DT55]|uniref:hypothetical protein n=1 Tax=Melissospora conviva TaxID=3388432 RepID=UPI003C18AEA6
MDVPAPAPEPTSAPPKWRRPALVAASACWALLLVVLTGLSIRDDEPTVREQRDIVQAMPVVERTLGHLVAAAAGPEAVLELGDLWHEECKVNPVLTGARLRGELIVRTAGEDVRPVLESVARRLPAEYRAGVGNGVNGVRLRADAGEFVSVRGVPDGPGRAIFSVDTGCRVVPADADLDAHLLPDTAREGDLWMALWTLDRDSAEIGARVWVPCPDPRTTVRRQHLFVAGDPVTAPGVALAALRTAETTVVVDEPDLYAARTGPVNLVARTVDGQTRLSVTLDCTQPMD